MPLPDPLMTAYEQNLKRQSDLAAQKKLDAIGYATPNYGSQSMTNSVNKYNYDRQQEYLNALAKREELAQTWQHTANQRALTAGQIQNTQNEHVGRLANLGYQQRALNQANQHQQQNLAQQWNMAQQKRLNEQEELQFRRKQLAEQKRQSDISNLMAKHQQIINNKLQTRHLNQDEWVNKTNAMLRALGLSFNMEQLQELRHQGQLQIPQDPNQMLDFLSNFVNTNEGRRMQGQQLGIQGLQARSNIAQSQAQTRAYLAQLPIHQQQFLINEIGQGALSLLHML